MNLIVAADRNWAIGNQGKLLVTIPQDQRLFREKTMGKAVVMGRKTLESLPGGRPLHGRTNLVLTHDPEYRVKGGDVCHSLEEVLKRLEQRPRGEVFIIGGESVYRQFLPYCDAAYVTRIDYEYAADTYFPDLERDPEWELAAESEEQTCFDLCYTFCVYQRAGCRYLLNHRNP